MKTRMFLTMLGLLLAVGCRSNDTVESKDVKHHFDTVDATAMPPDPFELTFAKNVRWTEGREGFDPRLPGYHLTGDISAIELRPRDGALPKQLVLAIQTSPGMRPNLEAFDLLTDSISIRTSGLSNVATETRTKPADGDLWERGRVERGRYLQFAIVGREVHVTFLPEAMALLKEGGTVSWIDWYRR